MPDMNPLMKRYLVFGWEAHEQRGGFHDFLRDFSSQDEAYLYAKATKESHKIDEYQIYDTYSGQIQNIPQKDINMTPKYPHITVNLDNVDGNAFAVMGVVTRALKKHGVSKEEIDAYRKESMSGDYDNLLQTIPKWVNVEWGYLDDDDDDDDDVYYMQYNEEKPFEDNNQ